MMKTTSSIDTTIANIDYNKLAGNYLSESMGALRQALELVEDAITYPNTDDYLIQRFYSRSDACTLVALASINTVSLKAMGHSHAAMAVGAAVEFVRARMQSM